MKKLKLWFLMLSLVVMASLKSEASVGVRAPKHVYTQSYSTVISSITAFTTLQATSTLQAQPGAVYQIILASGAASEFVTLYDTIPFNASILGQTAGSAYQLGPRYFYSSTTANTTITFDPPLEFYNGLMILDSSAAGQVGLTYELGRGLSGQ